QLADRLGVTPSTVSNYETGVSFPKEEMMLRLFDCLETDPNTLFQDSFRR
ncbi:Thioredoxin, partial [Dysosmobacter welbionis]